MGYGARDGPVFDCQTSDVSLYGEPGEYEFDINWICSASGDHIRYRAECDLLRILSEEAKKRTGIIYLDTYTYAGGNI